jgi:hypothetical protein
MTPRVVAKAAWAFATLNFPGTSFSEAACDHALEKTTTYDLHHVCIFLWSHALFSTHQRRTLAIFPARLALSTDPDYFDKHAFASL